EGELRGLAVVGPDRWPEAPDMPTVREAGYDVDACLNRRYWAPKGTPQEHVDVLADAIEAAANTDRVKDYLKRTGEELKILRGDELRAHLQKEYNGFLDVADMVKGMSQK